MITGIDGSKSLAQRSEVFVSVSGFGSAVRTVDRGVAAHQNRLAAKNVSIIFETARALEEVIDRLDDIEVRELAARQRPHFDQGNVSASIPRESQCEQELTDHRAFHDKAYNSRATLPVKSATERCYSRST